MEKISNISKQMLLVLLSDSAILSQVLLEGDMSKSCRVNDDGSVTFARNKWFWWSDLFNSTKTIGFNDLAIKITNTLAGIGTNKHPILDKGLKAEFIDTIFGGDINKLITCWLTSYLVAFDGESATYVGKENLRQAEVTKNKGAGISMIMVDANTGKPTPVFLSFEQIAAINSTLR